MKMKKIIPFIIITILLLSIATAEKKTNTKTDTTFTRNLEEKEISKTNETKLLDTYGKEFPEVKGFESYKEYKEFTIMNVTLNNNKYARIITTTNKFKGVTK